MKDVARLQQRLQESEQRCEALQNQVTSILAQFTAFRRDYEALAETTRAVVGERDLLKKRVAEADVIRVHACMSNGIARYLTPQTNVTEPGRSARLSVVVR